MFLLRLLYYLKNTINICLRRTPIVVPWYASEAEFDAIVRRSGELVEFKTYKQWKHDADIRVLEYTFQGFTVFKYVIDKKVLFLWLKENGLKNRSSSREAYCMYQTRKLQGFKNETT